MLLLNILCFSFNKTSIWFINIYNIIIELTRLFLIRSNAVNTLFFYSVIIFTLEKETLIVVFV